jgi:tetratricopeptide (TPR) repeat protein
VDRLIARCEGCSVERSFEFDISSFFGQFDKYAGYHQTDDLFRQAMRHVSADRMNQAEEALRRVVDPEEGEPAFAWGHYHLGVVLFVQGRLDEAATHLEQAITIQPLEPEIQEALGRTWRALGREAEGEKHLRQAERLRVRFAPSDSSEDPS